MKTVHSRSFNIVKDRILTSLSNAHVNDIIVQQVRNKDSHKIKKNV